MRIAVGDFFQRCRRIPSGIFDNLHKEIEFTGQSPLELLDRHWNWGNVMSLMENTIVWIGAGAFLARTTPDFAPQNVPPRGQNWHMLVSTFADDTEDVFRATVLIYGTTREQAVDAFRFVFELLIFDSQLTRVHFQTNGAVPFRFPVTPFQIQSLLINHRSFERIALWNVDLDVEQCQKIGTFVDQKTLIYLSGCSYTESAFAALFSCDGTSGLRKLKLMETVSSSTVAAIFCKKCRLRELALVNNHLDKNCKQQITEGIRNNKTLVRFDLQQNEMTDFEWISLFQAVRDHPTLESLDVSRSVPFRVPLLDSQKETRMRAVVDTLKTNRKILAIRFSMQELHIPTMPTIYSHLAINNLRHFQAELVSMESLSRRENLSAALVAGSLNLSAIFFLVRCNADILAPTIFLLRKRKEPDR